jgi:hypothetical protein
VNLGAIVVAVVAYAALAAVVLRLWRALNLERQRREARQQSVERKQDQTEVMGWWIGELYLNVVGRIEALEAKPRTQAPRLDATPPAPAATEGAGNDPPVRPPSPSQGTLPSAGVPSSPPSPGIAPGSSVPVEHQGSAGAASPPEASAAGGGPPTPGTAAAIALGQADDGEPSKAAIRAEAERDADARSAARQEADTVRLPAGTSPVSGGRAKPPPLPPPRPPPRAVPPPRPAGGVPRPVAPPSAAAPASAARPRPSAAPLPATSGSSPAGGADGEWDDEAPTMARTGGAAEALIRAAVADVPPGGAPTAALTGPRSGTLGHGS